MLTGGNRGQGSRSLLPPLSSHWVLLHLRRGRHKGKFVLVCSYLLFFPSGGGWGGGVFTQVHTKSFKNIVRTFDKTANHCSSLSDNLKTMSVLSAIYCHAASEVLPQTNNDQLSHCFRAGALLRRQAVILTLTSCKKF